MGTIKKLKNIIILVVILFIILSGTVLLDLFESVTKSVEELFSSKKSEYSNLTSQGYKYQSMMKSSQNAGSKPKQKLSAEELDQKIMQSGQKRPTTYEEDRDLLPKGVRIQRDDPRRTKEQLNEQKMAKEKFEMDFKELDSF